ncbi:MAG: sodium/proton-translocating pyrophosphatase, partial [Chloroflexota bacterium]|nr:sodium/proton-translocating pyrophosphatase [Chloroflexota bacterium]
MPISGVLALAVAGYFAYDVLRSPTGTPAMQKVAGAIYVAAVAFMQRQYRTIALLAVGGMIVIGLVIYFFESAPGVSPMELAIKTSIAFIVGAACSMAAGIVGMFVAVKSNLRTAAAAQHSVADALRISLRGGAVSGILVVALSLIGVFVMFIAYGGFEHPDQAPFTIVGFGFGASFVALFAQLGGGIYTKAADLGADLVGKIEAGIPEDDPRNAAVIADLVGDNVGDCAGRGADLFESTAAENIGAMILGVAIYAVTQNPAWILFPLVVRGFGLIASMIGIFTVRGSDTKSPMSSLNLGYYITIALSIAGMFLVTNVMLNEKGAGIWFFYAGVVGILTSLAFVYITQYYTAGDWRPV